MTSTLTPPSEPLTASLTLTDSPGGAEEGLNAVDDPGAFCALDAVETFMRRFLAITDEQACVLALFCVHTYAFSAAESTPYIRVTANTAAAGKTRVLEILEVLCENPWFTSRATGPAMVRRIAENSPTLLMDESDCLFSGGNQSQQMIRGVLNSGYRLGGKVAYAKGNTYEELDVFCPKAFAGIGDLPATVMSRSIPIVMKPKGPFDKVERLRQRDIKQEALVPKALARRFGAVNLKALTDSRPMIPEALDDRAADVWEPLLAIADVAGGDWPSRARIAAVSLCSERKRSGNTGWPFRLLTQVHAIFKQLDTDRLKTVTLLEALLADSEWQDIDQKGPLTAMMLADALRPFGVNVTKVRFGKQVAQGYLARDITRAVALLPDVPSVGTTGEDN